MWRDEAEGNEPVMPVDFEPIDWKMGYDIVNNPEQFKLYVDGELIIQQYYKNFTVCW